MRLVLDLGQPGAADRQVRGHLDQCCAKGTGERRGGAATWGWIGGAQAVQQLADGQLENRIRC